MRTQRKIFNLLDNNGESGQNFRYKEKINPVLLFDFSKPMYVTDKIDGTTVQMFNNQIYKRKDKFKRGDPRKHSASEEERYELILLDPNSPEWKWIFEAVGKHRKIFEKINKAWCLYFEVFGAKINVRFRNRITHDIRVFDTSDGYHFYPFKATIHLCKHSKLPIVGMHQKLFKNVDSIIEDLLTANYTDPTLRKFEFEGWVLRQGYQIAKIRKSDLKKLE